MKFVRTFVVCSAVAIWLFLFFGDEPNLDVACVNGTFSSPCCGTFVLKDGQFLVNNFKSVRYQVGQDKGGLYVLPAAYVGIRNGRDLTVDHYQYPLKLRLDNVDRPTSVELIGDSYGYVFTRRSIKVR